MRTRPLAGVVVGALALGLAGAAQSASAADPTFTVRGTLTSKTELRGTVDFARPSGWKKTAGGNRHSYVTYRIVQGACTLDLTASVRAKATSRRLDRVPDGVGALGSGTRPGGAWWTSGPEVSAGEGEGIVPGLYGIAGIRVAAKRYGQLRIQGIARGCDAGSADAEALFDPKGTTVRQVNHILKTAKTSLRVVRVK